MATGASETAEEGEAAPTRSYEIPLAEDVQRAFENMDVRQCECVSRSDLAYVLRRLDEDAWPDDRLDQLFEELFTEGCDAICIKDFGAWACSGSNNQAAVFATMGKARSCLPPPPPADFLRTLPAELPEGQPYYYLSVAQRVKCKRLELLRPYSPHLPGWVPHHKVADALGLGQAGIENALRRLDGRAYVWGTEFENVHTFWSFGEPRITVDGAEYHGSEDFYQASKPRPFSDAIWLRKRDSVMRTAVRHKFENDSLKQLLLSTGSHPLLSIKGDRYWGVEPSGRGENKLAVMLMELRDEWRDA